MNDEEEEEESTNEIILKISINGYYTQRGEGKKKEMCYFQLEEERPDDPSAFAVQQALLRRGNAVRSMSNYTLLPYT